MSNRRTRNGEIRVRSIDDEQDHIMTDILPIVIVILLLILVLVTSVIAGNLPAEVILFNMLTVLGA